MKDGYYVVKPWKLMEEQYPNSSHGSLKSGTHLFISQMETKIPKGRVKKFGELEGHQNWE